MRYVRDSFWSGRADPSLQAMVEGALVWCADVAPRRPHPRLRVPVGLVFREREQTALLPLPERPFAIVTWRAAKVHPDCHVAIDRVLYSVPWQHVGKTLQVKVGSALIELFDGPELVKTHPLAARGRQTDHADLPPDKVAFLMRTPAWCRKRAAEAGPAVAALVDGLLAEGSLTRLREVQAVLRLGDTYGAARLDAACALAATADGRMKTVRNLLSAGLDQRQLELALPTKATAYLHGPEAITGGAAAR